MMNFLVIERMKGRLLSHLIDQYKNIHIQYENLDSFHFIYDKPFILSVMWNGVKYEFLIRVRSNSSRMIVLGSGAGGYHENPIGPPIFQRHSWINDLHDTVIYYNDPTLYLGNILLGWGQGTKERYYLKDIATILTKLIEKTKVLHKNVLFFGSSGGGFMSLMLAGFLKDTVALVNNPQTCLTKWISGPVQNVFRHSYSGLSEEEIIEKYRERINVIEFYKSIQYVPEIHYVQNVACEFDVVNHMIPFIEGLKNIKDNGIINHVYFDLYHKIVGDTMLANHVALGKEETIHYLNHLHEFRFNKNKEVE